MLMSAKRASCLALSSISIYHCQGFSDKNILIFLSKWELLNGSLMCSQKPVLVFSLLISTNLFVHGIVHGANKCR